MSPTFQRQLLVSTAINDADARAIVELARALKCRDVNLPTRLQGKNVALLCPDREGESARRFDMAASAMGARVAHVKPTPAWLRDDVPLGAQTAHLLECLYDAVACEALPAGFAQRLQAQLGVPVYDGLGREDHPLFGLLPHMTDGGRPPGDDDRRALLQAVLMNGLV